MAIAGALYIVAKLANIYYRSALPSSLTFPVSPFTSTLLVLCSIARFINMSCSGYLPLILYLGMKLE